ncbi:hypothetical protein SDC9_176888 [bioreactor metagenome]|uniref:Uncharacterized protein n=1 Tax=bioreactor metagenome TaxID=1076179 RepID=A0A645GRR8_9ZZZZ
MKHAGVNPYEVLGLLDLAGNVNSQNTESTESVTA